MFEYPTEFYSSIRESSSFWMGFEADIATNEKADEAGDNPPLMFFGKKSYVKFYITRKDQGQAAFPLSIYGKESEAGTIEMIRKSKILYQKSIDLEISQLMNGNQSSVAEELSPAYTYSFPKGKIASREHLNFIEAFPNGLNCKGKSPAEIVFSSDNHDVQTFIMSELSGWMKGVKVPSNEELEKTNSIRFKMGRYKDKTPRDVLMESGLDAVRQQRDFMAQNAAKYPANQEYVDALDTLLKNASILEMVEAISDCQRLFDGNLLSADMVKKASLGKLDKADVQMTGGLGKGKTPIQYLKESENIAEAKENLKKQKEFLLQNIVKYPKNQVQIDAIDIALDIAERNLLSEIEKKSGIDIDIVMIPIHVNTYKKRPDGKVQARSFRITWHLGCTDPKKELEIHIRNSYAGYHISGKGLTTMDSGTEEDIKAFTTYLSRESWMTALAITEENVQNAIRAFGTSCLKDSMNVLKQKNEQFNASREK